MIVISDTSVISNLYQIGQLGLLVKLYKEVAIPPAVQHELFGLDTQREMLESLNWIKVVIVKNQAYVQRLITVESLDIGEAEAIGLALQESATWLLIDESAGRAVAQREHIKITGVLGVLVRAKQEGYILAVRPFAKQLLNIGFRLSPKLLTRVLLATGERPI